MHEKAGAQVFLLKCIVSGRPALPMNAGTRCKSNAAELSKMNITTDFACFSLLFTLLCCITWLKTLNFVRRLAKDI